jgi:DNA-binding NarL/FixJ family response regulator
VRILIAEDQLLLRQGLLALLDDLGHEVVGAAGTAPEAWALWEETRPELSLLDIRMPPSHRDEGLRVALKLREARPGAPVLLLSQYVEHLYVDELLATPGGGVGYLLKDRVFDAAAFGEALTSVGEGGTVVDASVVEHLMRRRRAQHALDSLTAREGEVLACMASGLSNAAIAERLVVTPKAVAKHINAIFSKLDLPSDEPSARRVGAVLAFLRA